uniref:MAGUK p55 scaffold protein 4 n=1 Tax=Takifugu rubripes TaxID=31033 RepID=H2TJB9_TAKRU
MRQAAEAQLLNPHCDLGEEGQWLPDTSAEICCQNYSVCVCVCVRPAGLRQILTDVIEEVRQSISLDIDGGDVVHSLLNASWLQSLLKVCHRLWGCCLLLLLFLLNLQVPLGSRPQKCKLEPSFLLHCAFAALLSAHDTVAQRDYGPVLPPMPDELPDDEEATRTVCLVKNNQPLGATIKRHEITGEIFIARVIHGGLADRSGLLHAGDRIIEVNGFSVGGMDPEQVIHVQARSQGTIMFKVVPITERPVHQEMMLYVRAMVNYNPQQDPTIPCADAGISFSKGDILEIVDQTDALWWQARKLPSDACCAGLIPSSSLLKRKQRELWWSQPYLPHACMQIYEETFESGRTFLNSLLAGFRRSLRLCRRRFYSTTQLPGHTRCPSNCSTLNVPYEEVVRYQRHPHDAHRLIALLGPSGVGVNELRKRLIETNPRLFQGAVPHTTRPPKGYEEPDRDYHFTSREIFDSMIYKNSHISADSPSDDWLKKKSMFGRFLEYGEYKGNLYGTSIESVKDVLSSGKICVIDIEPNAIQAVRTHELKAYVIYVKPPTLERLRESRKTAHITTTYYVNRPFQDEDLQEMEAAAQKIEAQYWQFFDHVIVNDELQDTCAQLLTVVNKSQDEPQWVPTSWIRPNTQL